MAGISRQQHASMTRRGPGGRVKDEGRRAAGGHHGPGAKCPKGKEKVFAFKKHRRLEHY